MIMMLMIIVIMVDDCSDHYFFGSLLYPYQLLILHCYQKGICKIFASGNILLYYKLNLEFKFQEVVMAANYEKILSSIGMLYQNSDKSNRQERLRLLSTVALHAPNETLKRFFQRSSKKGDLISVNEAEIVQAREYAKQFGPGTHVMPIGQGNYFTIIIL